MGILTVPLVASVAEDALFAVPGALREAAFGIGARRRTVSTRIVFPAAISGIVAAVILGISRAIGETMIVAIAAGATGGAGFTLDPLDHGQTMTGAISSLAIGSDQVRGADQAFNSLFLVGLLLFVITFALEPRQRTVRQARAEGVLMAAASPATATTRSVQAALLGRSADVRGRLFQAALLLTLLISLGVLVVLLTTVIVDAWPVLAERGADFVCEQHVEHRESRGRSPGPDRVDDAHGHRRRRRDFPSGSPRRSTSRSTRETLG